MYRVGIYKWIDIILILQNLPCTFARYQLCAYYPSILYELLEKLLSILQSPVPIKAVYYVLSLFLRQN